MTGCLEKLELADTLRVQDVDREIAFTLLSLACQFDRWQIDQVVAYIVRAGEVEVGRLVLAPGTASSPQVRIREHHTLLAQQDTLQPGREPRLQAEFANLCQHICQVLESLPRPGGSAEAEGNGDHLPVSRPRSGTAESDHFAYPWRKRLEIVDHYRLDRINGKVRNKDQWARSNYQISGRTLFNYECEFPQVEEWGSDPFIAGVATQE